MAGASAAAAGCAIVHLSDLHFGRSLKTTRSSRWRRALGISEHAYSLAVSVAGAVRDLQTRFPDRLTVVVTGDLTTSANAAAFEVVANYLNAEICVGPGVYVGLNLRGGAHVIPGNHDAFLRSLLGSRDRSEVYAEYFPVRFPDVAIWPTPLGHVTFLSLNSNRVTGYDVLNFRNLVRQGEVGQRQLGTLRALADALRARQYPGLPPGYDYARSFKVVLMHHHLVREEQPPGETAVSELRDAPEVIDALTQLEVDLVLCGHEHHPYHRELGGGRPLRFSCAGSATRNDEMINSFKVYYLEDFGRVLMEEHVATSLGRVYRFSAGAAVLL